MLRIGIMLDSYSSTAWVAKIVRDIQASEFARIELVVLNTPAPARKIALGKRLKNYWNHSLYHRYEQWDYARNRIEPDAKAASDLSGALAGVLELAVHPVRNGFTDRIPEDELEIIRGHRLDVLLRFGFRIIRGGILDAARYGVWSFHHDDNQEYRGGPPLFWEIYEQNPVSGTILQILNESLDGGKVIYRGHSSTEKSSLYRNRNPIYWKTAEYMLRRLRDLDQRGMAYIHSLPTYNEKLSYDKSIYRTPDALQMLRFMGRIGMQSIRGRLRSIVRGQRPQWFVAVRARGARSFNDASGYAIIAPQNNRFYADPFLIERDGKTYLFLEDYYFHDGRAAISCCEISADGTPGQIKEVLRRPYHLSYPFLFEEDGEVFMIPETKENRTIEMYRAVKFPDEWTLDTVLMKDIYGVDTTIYKERGGYWMFAATSNGRYSNSDELSLFFSPALRGPWQPHPCNPIVSDVRRARPAGALFRDEQGRLIRPAQDCSKAYGYAIVFCEVGKLNETEYEEKPIARLEPNWVKDNLGSHTYTRTEHLEVIDGNFAAKVSTARPQEDPAPHAEPLRAKSDR